MIADRTFKLLDHLKRGILDRADTALKTGRGFKLDMMPDGWIIKPMGKHVVRLSEQFLRRRGWRFDHLKQLVPVS